MTLARAANAEPANLAARTPGMVIKSLGAVLAVAGVAWGIGQVSDSSAATAHSSLLSKKSGVECVKDRFGRECGTGVGIENSELAISPDGNNAYLLIPFFDSEGERAEIQIYDRNPATGSLVQKQGTAGCIAEGKRKGCAQARGLRFGDAIEISPDGRNVYALTESGIVIFDRDPSTGNLTQPAGAAGCITSDLKRNPTCAPGRSLGAGIAISPDGLNVYTDGGSLATFDRDPTTGALTQKPGSEGAKRLGRGGFGVLVSPDGRNVYASTERPDRMTTFDRDPTTGALTRVPGRAGCISEKGKGGCRRGHELIGAGLSISLDGRSVYGADSYGPGAPDYGSLMILERLPDGSLTQRPGRAGCFVLYEGDGCARANSLSEANDTTVSADGKRVYVFNYYDSDAAIFTRHPSGRLTEGPDR
jgi:DNA-binding beta-propeller fold protein YncE